MRPAFNSIRPGPCRRSAATSPPAAESCCRAAWDQRGGPHVWNDPEPIPAFRPQRYSRLSNRAVDRKTWKSPARSQVKLWISSSAVDTDFTAKLIDVYPASADFPGGFDLNIGDGIRRARFRDSLKTETLMQPGVIYPLTIQLYPTSNRLQAGPSHPAGRVEQQLSAVRHQSEHGRASQRQPADQDRDQHRLSRCVPAVAAHPAHRAAALAVNESSRRCGRLAMRRVPCPRLCVGMS